MTWNIADRAVLITGGTSGLGRATALKLAEHGASVTITSRDAKRAERAAREITEATGSEIHRMVVDLSDLSSVRSFADDYLAQISRTDVLVNNAGNMFSSRRETVDGHEMTFATNHLGPFLLTSLLSESLSHGGTSRVINVSSIAHARARAGIRFDDVEWKQGRYTMMDVYGHSKLANILHAYELNARFGHDIDAYAMHPGVVGTSLGRGGSLVVRAATKFGRPWMRTADEGADTIVWLAMEPTIDTTEGIYFHDLAPEQSIRSARNPEQAARLWRLSESLVGNH